MKMFAIKEAPIPEEEKLFLKKKWQLLKSYQAVAAKLNKSDIAERGLLHKKISSLRAFLEATRTSSFELSSCFKNNKARFFSLHDYYPSTADIKNHLKQARNQIKVERARIKSIRSDSVEYNGLSYQKQGGVFVNPSEVLKIKQGCNPASRINKTKRPSNTFKTNYLGIEFEFLTKLDITEVQEKFIDAKLEGYVHVGTDGSVSESGYRGLEVRLLVTECGAKSIISEVCRVLREDCNGHVNNTCGLHVHFDMRNRDASKAYHNMTKILPLLTKMVPQTRISGESTRYCKLNKNSSLETQLGLRDRYYAINAQSIEEHTTLEVRLHSGTLNAAKVFNWIQVITTAINCQALLKNSISSSVEFASTFECTNKLVEYIEKRTDTFSGKDIDTTTDDITYINYELCA